MLVPFSQLLEIRRGQRAAIGAFTCYNFENAAGVLAAAEQRGAGVILLIGAKSFETASGPGLVAALRAMAALATIPVCLQLDHVGSLDAIRAAFELGVAAVMADGPSGDYEENVRLVRQAVAIARRFGGEVEAELGRIEGDEDVAGAALAGTLTDPAQARDFLASTGATCLAVSIGNVHGVYHRPPQLDWARLAAIRDSVDRPLSLHGASGIPDPDVRRAVALGIAKVNVNTELRQHYLRAVADHLDRVIPGLRVLELNQAMTEAVTAAAEEKLRCLEAGPEPTGG